MPEEAKRGEEQGRTVISTPCCAANLGVLAFLILRLLCCLIFAPLTLICQPE
jgi:hypothetical protein